MPDEPTDYCQQVHWDTSTSNKKQSIEVASPYCDVCRPHRVAHSWAGTKIILQNQVTHLPKTRSIARHQQLPIRRVYL